MIPDVLTLSRLRVQTDLLDLVGSTPLIPLRRVFASQAVELYAKPGK